MKKNPLKFLINSILNIKIKIRHFFQRIRRCIEWSIFLWNDFDYDYSFIFRVLKYKISRVRKHLENHCYCIGSKNTTKRMKIVEAYLNRMLKNNYCDKDFEWLHNKFGIRHLETREVVLKNTKYYEYLGFRGEKAITEADRKLENWYYNFYHEKEKTMRQSDWEEVLRLMRKYIIYWWD